MGAGLENRLLFRRLAIDRLALGKEMCDRFFAVNILAIAQRLKGLQRVPVVRRGDDDRVEILAGAQLAEIVVGIAWLRAVLFADGFGCGLGPELAIATAAIVGFIRIEVG